MDRENEGSSAGWVALLIIAIVLLIIAVVGYVQSRTTGVSTWVWVVLGLAVFIAILALIVYFYTRPVLVHHEEHELIDHGNGEFHHESHISTGMMNSEDNLHHRVTHVSPYMPSHYN